MRHLSDRNGNCEVWTLTRHGRGQLPGSAVGHMDDGRGSFIHHHLVLVPQAALNEVKQRTVMTENKKTKNVVNNLQVLEVSFTVARRDS